MYYSGDTILNSPNQHGIMQYEYELSIVSPEFVVLRFDMWLLRSARKDPILFDFDQLGNNIPTFEVKICLFPL